MPEENYADNLNFSALYRHVLTQSLAISSPAIFAAENFCLNLHKEEEY